MSTVEDTEQASECLDHLQTMLWEKGDHSQDDEISSLICMLQSPLFRQLLVLQDSIQELEQVNDTHGLQNYDFSFMPELQLETKSQQGDSEVFVSMSQPTYESMPSYDQEMEKVLEKAAEGREVQTIKLFKPEKQSLGFSVVTHAEGGIFVQDIQPGGIAERHGSLRERDQILSIDGQPLDISHQEAIKILQQSGGLVELVVARGPIPAETGGDAPATTTQDLNNQQSADSTDMVLNTEWTQIEVIDLINDGTGLGFGIIGGRSTGVVVKTILPGGVADVDGRLRSGDHILQIGEVNVRGMGSEQVAAVLRQSGSHVRLIVARPINEPPAIPVPHAPIVPTGQLDEHLEQINSIIRKEDEMVMEGQKAMVKQRLAEQQQEQEKSIIEEALVHNPPPFGEDPPPEYPEVQYYDVTLEKDIEHGLGITIAGYVGRDNNTPGTDDLCGIFVNSITKGSAADKDGQIRVNDQIIEVDGQLLQGLSNHDAVEILRNNGQVVNLKLARYQHGAKFERLQQYLAEPQPILQMNGQPGIGNEPDQNQLPGIDAEDSGMQEDLDGEILPDVEAGIKACWEPIVGEEFEIVVSQLSKFREGGGLGISLEGTVDVENGVEVRPHHYIRAILPAGPVGVNGRLCSGDELLEVNGKRLLGLNHKEVVGILKELPQNVRLVCARRKNTPNDNNVYAEEEGEFQTPPLKSGVSEFTPDRLVKSKSDMALSSEPNAQTTTNLSGKKSRSLEPLTGLAMWSSEPVVIELRKGDRGLGFSILDYQDPVNPNETVIVIKSLVPGGVAQMDGRLVPGDRLMFVNEVNLENATLDEAVQALKGAQKGLVRIGVAKPLPLSGTFQEQPLDDSEITASMASPQMSPPMDTHSHDYMNIEEFTGANGLPSQITRNESMSSSSTSEGFARRDDSINLSKKDSFYESDENLTFLSPSKTRSPDSKPTIRQKPAIKEKPSLDKFRPVPVPRKQDSQISNVTSYENEEAIQNFRSQELAQQLAQEMAEQGARNKEKDMHAVVVKQQEYDLEEEMSANLRSENHVELGFTDIEQNDGSSSPEIFDYENSSLGPLPSYEEAISGDAEFFNMDDLEGPPVPIRADSQHVVMAMPPADTDSPKTQKSPQPSPRRTTPEKPKGLTSPRPKPLIPPKPVSPYTASLSAEVQEEGPPPLPVTSPPPLLPLDDDTKSSTSNTSTTPISVKENPLSRLGMVSPGSDTQEVKSDLLDSSSSSDQFNQSDLKVVQTSPSSSPRTASPGISPITSPSLMRSFSGPDALPPSLERKVILKRSDNNLGITVEASEKGINGCIVKSLAKTGAIYKHGQIKVGDYVMAINNESMRRITNTQARVILRRASLMGTADISISYVTAADAAAHKESVAKRQEESPSTPTMMPSPKSTLSPLNKRSSTSDGSAPSSPLSSPQKSSRTPQASPRQKETVVVGSGNQTWGPPRLVELYREPGKTLGISIVGGRVDMYQSSEEHVISGIFIKHVLEDSPAGRNGTLKTGDRILQVDGKDLRNATHDQAVDTIRNASNPVKFVVQSLVDPACPKDLDTDNKSVHSYDEGSLKIQSAITSTINSAQTEVPPVQSSSPVPTVEALPAEPEPEVLEEPEEEEEPEDEFGYSNLYVEKQPVAWKDCCVDYWCEKARKHMKRIQRRYGELNGELLLVDLRKATSGLGISLAGNKDRNTMSVFVAGIQPESSAGLDGRIQVGDELLEVNGNVLYGRSHLNASAIIKGLNAQVIKFVLLRRDDNLDRMAVKPLKVSASVPTKQVEKPPAHSEPATLSPTPTEVKPLHSPNSPSIHDVIHAISLNKGPSGLGFAIIEESRAGREGIYVRSITYGGVADRDGQLSVSDQILEVQDKSLVNVHYDKAIEILRNSQGTVKLKVRKYSPDGTTFTPNNVQGQGQIILSSQGESSTDGPGPGQEAVDPLTCVITPGQETTILIEKGRTGLGLSIVGGADTLLGAIIIHEVYEDGAAARDGRLWAGDQILEVNHENLREATHDYAIQVLRQTPATVQILVFRDDAHVKEEDIYDIFTVELIKKPGKGLGLSIVGKRNDVGVYISDIVKGGAAEADARLMQGDQILAVNGEDMRNATQEYAAAVLKTTMGKVTLTVGRLKAGSRTSSRRNSNSALKKSESTASNKSKGGRHSKKGSEDMSHIRTVELEHDTNGSLGLSIAGGIGSPLGDTPILVANLTPGGPAEKSRKLKVGDKILSINGVSTDGMNHDQVIQILKSSRGSITLQVTQGEQTPVSVSGRSSSTKGIQPDVQTRNTPLENNVFDDTEEGPPPQWKTITLERGPDGLGFSIVGGHASPHGDLPIYVKNVFSKGAAADNGQLKRGDQILSVNGTSLEGLTHEEAVNILKNAKGSVIMNVLS